MQQYIFTVFSNDFNKQFSLLIETKSNKELREMPLKEFLLETLHIKKSIVEALNSYFNLIDNYNEFSKIKTNKIILDNKINGFYYGENPNSNILHYLNFNKMTKHLFTNRLLFNKDSILESFCVINNQLPDNENIQRFIPKTNIVKH